MGQEIRIRDVTVELLRSGPSHNQLLSPLTLYLGICDEAEAGLVTIPFEHHTFVRRMAAFRYGAKAIATDKLPEMRSMGIEMAKLLGAVPRLPGSLTVDGAASDTLVHLRLVLSAAELALLPFEMAQLPVAPNAWEEKWLALQSRMPVVITRRTRNVALRNEAWLADPRILFVSAADEADAIDGDGVPFVRHREALIAAVKPFLMPDEEPGLLERKGRRETFGQALTILREPTIAELAEECSRERYSHIHILAHGAQDGEHGDASFGLRLHPDDGVVHGERLSGALVGSMQHGRVHKPEVVTLATCDSGNQDGVVYAPGASLAHRLHQDGVALVLASQFPLSKDGSVLLVREFYRGLLWGENPWVLLHQVRKSLHARLSPGDHDWASLVVYEALNLDVYKLDQARYGQCERAMHAAWMDPDGWEEDAGEEGQARWKSAVVKERLPVHSKYFGMRARALRADAAVQDAIDLLALVDAAAAAQDAALEAEQRVAASCQELEAAMDDYEAAVNGFLVGEGQGMNVPFRALVALQRLRCVLGKPDVLGEWDTARYWISVAQQASADPDERLWAHASMVDLMLLKLLSADSAERAGAADEALKAAGELMRAGRQSQGLQQRWLAHQLQACIDGWGSEEFECAVRALGNSGRRDFALGENNLVEVSRLLLRIIDREGERERAALAAAPPPPPRQAEPKGDSSKPNAKAANGLLGSTKAVSGPVPKPVTKPHADAAADVAKAWLTLDMLPAQYGDSLWIEYGAASAGPARVLIDCGPVGSYAALRSRIEALPREQRRFELFILSHIDDDHIGAAIKLLKDAPALGLQFGDVWFNGWPHISSHLNAKQGEAFGTLLAELQLPWNLAFGRKAVLRGATETPVHTLPGGMKLTLLSPTPERLKALARAWQKEIVKDGAQPGTREAAGRYLGRNASTSEDVPRLAAEPFESDSTAPNGSSIAVLAEWGPFALLLGADAYAPVLQQAVKLILRERGQATLRLDAFKLPHHGSQNNLSSELLSLLHCEHFLVSTSGQRFKHPDRQAIARVIEHGRKSGLPATLWFNYRAPAPMNGVWDREDLKRLYGYRTVYPAEGEQVLRFSPA